MGSGPAAGRFQIPRLKATSVDPAVDLTAADLLGSIGAVKIPEVIFSFDAAPRFSAVLLGGDVTNAAELEALYAALLALGTDKTAADMRALSKRRANFVLQAKVLPPRCFQIQSLG